MKLLKLQAWEQHFKGGIEDARKEELIRHMNRGAFRALNQAISNAVPAIVLVVTLTAYMKTGKPIVASTIFTAISLFNQLRFPLLFYPRVIDSLANGKNEWRGPRGSFLCLLCCSIKLVQQVTHNKHYHHEPPPKVCDLNVDLTVTPPDVVVTVNPSCETTDRPGTLTFRYTGGGCTASDNAATYCGDKAPTCADSKFQQYLLKLMKHTRSTNGTVADGTVCKHI